MFKSIYVPVDNSEYSNRAIQVAIQLGGTFDSKMVGSHVYAAAMHDYRFKQMEFTLPDEYLQENEIERQRKIHDSLITMGLELISDCYLNAMDQECIAAGLKLERKMMDGKHHVELVKDIEECAYDLTVIGALGVGKTKDSEIGSVCERVLRQVGKDVLVVKHLPKEGEPERDKILVGVDGSPQSFGGLITAIEIAKKLDKRLELISVYDPYLHYLVFNSVVDVLTEKAAKVFRFEEQNQLHEEIIDTGLAQIYQSHLNVAESMANERGVEVTKTLLDGKAFQKILEHIRNDPPFLLVIGKVGVHKLKEENTGLGSNSENLLRKAPCDILFSTNLEYPALDRKAEESILWTAEAEARMTRVPALVKGIARTGILRLAIEQGHSVITESVIEEAMDRFMPKHAAKATKQLAEAVAFERAREGKVSQCKKCGVVATEPDPVRCGVCKGTEFEVITSETIDQIAASQGGVSEETTYDGRKLKWSEEARHLLLSIEDKYQKRRVKARIEKTARVKRLDVITFEFAKQVIIDEIGHELPFEIPGLGDKNESNGKEEANALEGISPLSAHDPTNDMNLLATDDKGVQFRSVYQWTPEALDRILRTPSGFMRDKTQERIEKLALENRALVVDMDLVDAGLEIGRKVMEDVVKSGEFFEAFGDPEALKENAPEGKCPFSAMFSGDQTEERSKAFQEVVKTYEEKNATCPNDIIAKEVTSEPESSTVSRIVKKKTISHVHTGPVDDVLNQAGVMHQMERKRQRLKGKE